MNKQGPPLIFLSTGGTGGHVMPALALAEELVKRDFRVDLITDIRGKQYTSLFKGNNVHLIRSGTFTSDIKGKLSGFFNLGLGAGQSLILSAKYRPVLVVGFGGYPSLPAVYVAQKMQIRTLIHEQNAIIGKANAFLAQRADAIAFSLSGIQGLDESEMKRAVLTGNPVRKDIAVLKNQPYPMIDDNGRLRIFIMGGSLGARVFSDIIPKACSGLFADYKARLHIVQQCRGEDMEETRRAYREIGVQAELRVFFDNVAEELSRAHLIIARSGASTVAEITAAGRPAIFVPYPHHKDQQQKMNANVVADAGGAWVMTENGFTAEALQARPQTFLQNPNILITAAEKSRSCGRPDATEKLADLAEKLVHQS